ncbi:cytochrome C [Thioalkalivibrio denitrificans]|uniref:Cytochrome C n=1 Tax=Thioalkalivibrio denitrificans TaxID=108003 RepID=A0A1V3NRA4_9GAMM|nr:cytochrome c [Thioalkalivibrio denitrificans]OOG27645.1 cytochrome C [Thioalkalivibrio denitrificans]
MNIRIPLITALLGLGLLAGCGESPETAQPSEPPARSEAAPSQAPAQAVTPREDFRIPPEGFQTDVRRGRELFQANCMECHGADALGTDQGPPLIHRIYEPSHHSDLAFYIAIARGTHQHHWEFGDMPPVPAVDGEDAAHIIAWIRQEQREAGIE